MHSDTETEQFLHLRVLYITPQIALQICAEFLDTCGGENNGVAPTAFSLWGRPPQAVGAYVQNGVCPPTCIERITYRTVRRNARWPQAGISPP